MIALFSPGSSALAEVAAAPPFLLSLGLPASGWVTTGAVAVVAPDFAGVTVAPGVVAGWTGAAAAADVAVEPAAELAAGSGTVGCVAVASVGDCGAGAAVAAGAVEPKASRDLAPGSPASAIPASASTRSTCGCTMARNPGWYVHAA